jgi:uncharacterized membrane protein YgcG
LISVWGPNAETSSTQISFFGAMETESAQNVMFLDCCLAESCSSSSRISSSSSSSNSAGGCSYGGGGVGGSGITL